MADSGLGIHGGTNAWFPLGEVENTWEPLVREWREMGFTWVKILSAGNNLLSAERCIDTILRGGLTPVIRYIWDNTYPVTITGSLLAAIREATRIFVSHGVKYFETDNEINIVEEWAGSSANNNAEKWVSWHKYDAPLARPNHAADVWLAKAVAVLKGGGMPGLIALSPGGNYDDEVMIREILQRIKDTPGGLDVLGRSFLACHSYGWNHPWNYPYDPINQKDHPGATVFSGGQSNGLCKAEFLHGTVERMFGLSLPVIITEGGPRLGDADDNRYPVVTPEVHAWMILNEARYMAEGAPPWLLAQTGYWVFASKQFGEPSLVWEKHAWRSPVRTPHDVPVIAALKARGYVPRSVTPAHSFVDVVDTLPKNTEGEPYEARAASAITHIVLHHSAAGAMKSPYEIAKYHTDKPPVGHGWPGIGYHVYITGDGTIYRTQRIQTISWQTENFNGVSVGVCLAGALQTNLPTPAQLSSLQWALRQLQSEIGHPVNVIGHLQAPGADTVCPGGEWWKQFVVSAPAPSPQPTEAQIREAAWNNLYPTGGIPYNPTSAFFKEAAEMDLGLPVTRECDLGILRFQGFRDWIVVARTGEWDNMWVVGWF